MEELQVAAFEERGTVWGALCKHAAKFDLPLYQLKQLDIGDNVVSVTRYENGMFAMFAARVGWYSAKGNRTLTDITTFVWHAHEPPSEQAAGQHARMSIKETRAVYLCDSDRRARLFAAIASEDGDFPMLERYYRGG